MKFRPTILSACIAAGAILSGAAASAATMYNAGTYDVSSVQTGSNDHTLWLVDFMGSGDDRYWQFLDGSNALVVDENGATLTATAYQNTNPDNQLLLSMDLTRIAGPGAGGPKCGGDCSDISGWTYYDYITATLTGVGDLAGIILNLEIRPINDFGVPTIPFQLGLGANDKDASFGGSSWFTWTEVGGERSGHGDVNISVSAVPLPMPALMLLTGLGVFGFVQRRQQS